MLLGGAVAFFAVALAYYLAPSSPPRSATDDAATTAPPAPTSPPLPSAPSSGVGTTSCDDRALYVANLDAAKGDQQKAEARTVEVVKGWTPECRWQAFESACATRCWDFETQRLITAAGTPAEATKLRSERLRRNEQAEQKLKDVLGKVAALVKHANTIRSSARGTTGPCMTRMAEDFSTIKKLRAEVDKQLAELPAGSVGLRQTLGLAKACVDCSTNRVPCDDMNESLKIDREVLTETTNQNTRDRAALKAR